MIIALKIINTVKNDPSSEIFPIASDGALGYIYFLLLVSMFSWCAYAYVWSFLFKSEIIGFVVLAIFLGFMAFIDIIWIFLQLLLIGDSSSSGAGKFIEAIRYLFALLFPNVTMKRGFYDMKIRNNSYCISNVNLFLGGKIWQRLPIF
jgi:hypothetical protein